MVGIFDEYPSEGRWFIEASKKEMEIGLERCKSDNWPIKNNGYDSWPVPFAKISIIGYSNVRSFAFTTDCFLIFNFNFYGDFFFTQLEPGRDFLSKFTSIIV